MAQSYSGTINKEYNGQRYTFRTATIYNTLGTPGTIVTGSAKTTLQLDLGFPVGYVNIAERNVSGGWTFTPAAGDDIKKDLTKRGPGSLTSQLDNATIAALKTNARITDAQARQALDISQNITGTTALVEPDQNIDGSSGGTNAPTDAETSGSSQSLTPEQQKSILDTVSKGQVARTKYDTDLKYPVAYEGNDYFTIEMIRYVPSSNLSLGIVSGSDDTGSVFDSGLGLPGISERSSSEASIAKITLPIPSNLIDSNPVDWTNSELNPLQAYGAGAIGRILGGGNFAASVGSEIKKGADVARQNADTIKPILNNEIIKQILGVNTLTRSTGAVVNPNTELLFKGPSLRTFTFSFKMTPRSKKESEVIKKIIRTLKQGMAVKRTANQVFLASPNVFRLKFWYVEPISGESEIIAGTPKEHPFLPRLKVCALQNMSMNYMPDGSYMTYGDGSMVGYDMTLTFSEIDPIFDDDYTNLDQDKDEVIGY
jgi:hypothetical protein